MSAVKINAKEATPVQVRFGVDIQSPLGMRPDVDPLALGKGDFVLLENTRRIGSTIVGRPGSSGWQTLGGLVTGLGDLPVGSIGGLMMVSDGCPGEDPTVGFSLLKYDEEQINDYGLGSTRFFPLIYRTTAASFKIARFVRDASEDGLVPAVDAMFFAADNVLYRLAEVPFPYGVLPITQTNGSQEIPVWTLPAPYTSIGEMMQFGSSLYISAVAGAGASAIFAYDGLTFTRVLSGVDPITGFGLFRNLLIAGHDGGTNLIRIWNGTSWSTVAPGVGTVKIAGNRCASYHDVFYIPSDDNIYSFDGTTLTQIPPGTTGVDVGAVVFSLESCFDKLYATWSTVAPKARLLRYDGTTWSPNHKDFIAQFPGAVTVRTLRFFHGALMVGGIATGSSAGARLYRSDRRNTSGTYTELLPHITVNTLDIRDLVRSRS